MSTEAGGPEGFSPTPDSPQGRTPDRAPDHDEALVRLEEFLLRHPPDRALPDPEDLLARLGLPPTYLRDDERARKVYLDALGGRPLSDLVRISALNTEVELLTVEVEFMTERLGRPSLEGEHVGEIVRRLGHVRRRLGEIRDTL